MLSWALCAGLLWQTLSPEVVRHAKAGLDAKQQGHMPEAIDEFKRVTELAPTFAAGFVNLGAAYIETHNYPAAIPALKRALELDASLIGADQMLGYALLAAGYATEALPHLEKVGARDAIGIAQVKLGRFPEAIANLNAALAQRPNDPDLLYYLGRASGLYSKQIFDTLESTYPNSARAHQSLAENQTALKQPVEAEKEFQAALQLRPDAPGIHLELGELYAVTAQWAKAENEFRTEAKLQPGDAETAYRFGDALLQQGKVQEAKVELELSNTLRPAMPETLLALGKTASLSGDSTLAEKSWKELLSTEKSGPLANQAHFSLANLYRKQGKQAEAQQEMREYHATPAQQ